MKEPNKITKDPICGMTVSADFAIHAERGGKTYYFCGESCRQRFITAPDPDPKKPKEKFGHGWS